MSSPLDASEVEALMQAIQDGRVAPESGSSGARGPVVPYDLTSQDRIIRGAMPTLDTINDRIASLFTKTLAASMRGDIKVGAAANTLLKFVDAQQGMTPPTTFGILSLGPGHGLALLVLENELAKHLLAGALGEKKRASAQTGEPRTELTNVERLVLRHSMSSFAEAVTASWADVLSFKPEILRFETDPRLVAIASPSDVMVMCPFEITGDLEGRMQLLLPYSSLEPAKKRLATQPRIGGPQGDARFSVALERELDAVLVELHVEMGRRRLNLSDLIALEVGQVLTLNTSERAPLPVFVQGRLKMTASPKVISGGIAAEVLLGLKGFTEEQKKPKSARAEAAPPSATPAAGASPAKGRAKVA
jgi:flagellar motor switch protein FliM